MDTLIAAERGFSGGDAYVAGLVFVGFAIVAAIGALSHERERAFSASLVYLALGFAAAVAIEVVGLDWVDPLDEPEVVERVTELAVIIALFATGLKLDRPFEWRAWSGVSRLLALAMPLTILGVVVFGTQVAGLSLGAAIVLGAILAPTDPVLAGDVGVGPPGDEHEHEPNFSITGEAGLNDGLALPFLFLGLFVVDPGGTSWLGEWLLADVLYAIVAGVAIGVLLGYCFAAAAVRLRDRQLLATAFDAWLAVPAVLAIYGLTELVGAYGFIAAFAGGLAFRRYEHGHDYNRRVHEGAEVAEKFGELAAILLLGSMLSVTGLGAPGVSGWLLVAVLILVIRPVAVAISSIGSRLPRGERLFMAWFGVRGIGSLYYLAIAVGSGYLAAGEAETVAWTAIAVVIGSIVVHGVTAAPLTRRWLPPEAMSRGIADREQRDG
ncbi:MAG TPA: sodium:proton antiporter [Solirubrobacterales bacterium]